MILTRGFMASISVPRAENFVERWHREIGDDDIDAVHPPRHQSPAIGNRRRSKSGGVSKFADRASHQRMIVTSTTRIAVMFVNVCRVAAAPV
jgi:hypothetical protein